MRDYVPFLFFTDPHITDRWPGSRTDNFLETILTKIAWLVALANRLDAYILVGGDWVNRYTSKPEVVNRLMTILRLANKGVFGIIGNHDIYGHNYRVINQVTVGSLFASGLVTLLDYTPLIVEESGIKVQLTGANYFPDMDRDKSVYSVPKLEEVDQAIHLTHSFLVAKPWPKIAEDKFTCIDAVNTGVDVVCIGHDHRGFGIEARKGVVFTNPGALGRISSDLVELKRMPKASLIKVYKDHSEVTLVDVPAEPGDKVLSRDKILEELERKKTLYTFKESLNLNVEHIDTDINQIFDKQAELLKLDPKVREVSIKAVNTYEASLVSKKIRGKEE